MFKLLSLLLIFGLFAFLTLGVFLGRVIRFFNPTSTTNKNNRKQRQKTSAKSQTGNYTEKKFSKNEGEYVSYEEIKEDK